jgi:hypothetical protein
MNELRALPVISLVKTGRRFCTQEPFRSPKFSFPLKKKKDFIHEILGDEYDNIAVTRVSKVPRLQLEDYSWKTSRENTTRQTSRASAKLVAPIQNNVRRISIDVPSIPIQECNNNELQLLKTTHTSSAPNILENELLTPKPWDEEIHIDLFDMEKPMVIQEENEEQKIEVAQIPSPRLKSRRASLTPSEIEDLPVPKKRSQSRGSSPQKRVDAVRTVEEQTKHVTRVEEHARVEESKQVEESTKQTSFTVDEQTSRVEQSSRLPKELLQEIKAVAPKRLKPIKKRKLKRMKSMDTANDELSQVEKQELTVPKETPRKRSNSLPKVETEVLKFKKIDSKPPTTKLSVNTEKPPKPKRKYKKVQPSPVSGQETDDVSSAGTPTDNIETSTITPRALTKESLVPIAIEEELYFGIIRASEPETIDEVIEPQSPVSPHAIAAFTIQCAYRKYLARKQGKAYTNPIFSKPKKKKEFAFQEIVQLWSDEVKDGKKRRRTDVHEMYDFRMVDKNEFRKAVIQMRVIKMFNKTRKL